MLNPGDMCTSPSGHTVVFYDPFSSPRGFKPTCGWVALVVGHRITGRHWTRLLVCDRLGWVLTSRLVVVLMTSDSCEVRCRGRFSRTRQEGPT